jgi:hypothetical protein
MKNQILNLNQNLKQRKITWKIPPGVSPMFHLLNAHALPLLNYHHLLAHPFKRLLVIMKNKNLRKCKPVKN